MKPADDFVLIFLKSNLEFQKKFPDATLCMQRVEEQHCNSEMRNLNPFSSGPDSPDSLNPFIGDDEVNLGGEHNESFEDYESVISDIEETLSVLSSQASRSVTPCWTPGPDPRPALDRHVTPVLTVFDDLKDYLSDSDLSLDYKIALQKRKHKNNKNLKKQAQLSNFLIGKKVSGEPEEDSDYKSDKTRSDESGFAGRDGHPTTRSLTSPNIYTRTLPADPRKETRVQPRTATESASPRPGLVRVAAAKIEGEFRPEDQTFRGVVIQYSGAAPGRMEEFTARLGASPSSGLAARLSLSAERLGQESGPAGRCGSQRRRDQTRAASLQDLLQSGQPLCSTARLGSAQPARSASAEPDAPAGPPDGIFYAVPVVVESDSDSDTETDGAETVIMRGSPYSSPGEFT